jgi:hypothetical protein
VLSRRIRHIPALLLLGSGLAQAVLPAQAQVPALVGILQSDAVLVRPPTALTAPSAAPADTGAQ